MNETAGHDEKPVDNRGADDASATRTEQVGQTAQGAPTDLWSFSDSRDPRMVPPWFRRAVITVILLALATRMGVWAFTALKSFWYTLAFAFFLGLAMEPVVNKLAARGQRRGVGTAIVLGGLLLSVAAFFAVFGNLLVEQLSQLVQSVPNVLHEVLDWINRRFHTSYDTNSILKEVGLGVQDFTDIAAKLGLGLLGVLGSALSFVFNTFTVLLFAFYFAADGPRLRRTMAAWMSPSRQRTFLTVWDISTQKAGGYVISRTLMALISAIAHGVCFLIIDLPYWLPMAIWVGLVSQFIPTIGTYLAGALPVILALTQGSPMNAIIVLAFVTVYQQVENYFIQPRITQSTLQIHAAVAFGSVIVGASLFGATGALLAIPVVATLQSVLSVYGNRYELVPELMDPNAPTLPGNERMTAAIRAAGE